MTNFLLFHYNNKEVNIKRKAESQMDDKKRLEEVEIMYHWGIETDWL